jgi:hypothetical protein
MELVGHYIHHYSTNTNRISNTIRHIILTLLYIGLSSTLTISNLITITTISKHTNKLYQIIQYVN